MGTIVLHILDSAHRNFVRSATHYQVDLTIGPFQPYLSDLNDTVWLALEKSPISM
jgi:hypothetical protein